MVEGVFGWWMGGAQVHEIVSLLNYGYATIKCWWCNPLVCQYANIQMKRGGQLVTKSLRYFFGVLGITVGKFLPPFFFKKIFLLLR